MRTVKEISDLTGISVRTLHYYDEIGLLKPTKKSDAGYRLYDDKAFEILFDRYKNLLRKYSVINGVFDDDLYQEQCMIFVHCIEIFEVK